MKLPFVAATVLLLVGALLASCQPDVFPPVIQSETNATLLRIVREDTTALWAQRTNWAPSFLEHLYDLYATEDHEFIIDETGSFDPKAVAMEYAKEGDDPTYVQLKTIVDRASFEWVDEDTLAYREVTNYTLWFVSLENPPQFDGFVNRMIIKFAPGSNLIKTDYARQVSLIRRYLGAAVGATPVPDICATILSACTGEHQVYATMDECLTFLWAVANQSQVCPSGFVANSTTCYAFHAHAAIAVPSVHCPHVTPFTTSTCRDFCVEEGPCGNCHPNAACVYVTPEGQITPEYACQCKSGYSGDGVVSCAANLCPVAAAPSPSRAPGHHHTPGTTGHQNQQPRCPSDPAYSECSGSLCGCLPSGGFVWNATVDAALSRSACQCEAGENVFFTGVNNSAECIPEGYCRTVDQCPQYVEKGKGHTEELPQSVACITYGTNFLIPYKTCLCNYGYANPGFSYDCQCPAPKREAVISGTTQKVCLSPGECTCNGQCPRGTTCSLAANPDAPDGVGLCVA